MLTSTETKPAVSYFKKEIITNPFYLPTGEPLSFRKVNGHIGVYAADNPRVTEILLEASRKRIGGIIEIDEETFRNLLGEEFCAGGGIKAPVINGGFHPPLQGASKSEPGIVSPPTFYHSGDLGDIIYAMAAIKSLGGGVVHLGPDNRTTMPTREPMSPGRFGMIAPLLAAQPYINRVEFSQAIAPGLDYDLNQFRKQIIGTRSDVAPGMNLARCVLKHFGQPLESDEQPWLSVDSPLNLDGKCVILARSHRYHNPRFNWREIVRRYGPHSVFIGSESEWREFCREFGPVDYHRCADLLEAARLIAGAKLFVGNQSCPYAIAEGLKQNAILEVAPQAPNCMFERPNAWAVWKTPFQLPVLDDLENAVRGKIRITEIAFDEDYFMRGQEKGVSNYTNYSWMPEVTLKLADAIRGHLGIKKSENVLDFGCAKGFLVRAFRERGIEAYGCDISEWAVENCDPMVKNYVMTPDKLESILETIKDFNWIIAKDVLEHVPLTALESTVKSLLKIATTGMFIVVPLTSKDGGEFICPRDNQDATHAVRWTLATWLKFLRKMDQSFIYHGSFHIPGIKQASEPYEASCGFITAKRIG